MAKDLTKDDTKKVALDLISMHGKTTTLEVKTELRARDFFAEQSKVSLFMTELAKELNWQTKADGGHKLYTDATKAGAWWDDEEEDANADPPEEALISY